MRTEAFVLVVVEILEGKTGMCMFFTSAFMELKICRGEGFKDHPKESNFSEGDSAVLDQEENKFVLDLVAFRNGLFYVAWLAGNAGTVIAIFPSIFDAIGAAA